MNSNDPVDPRVRLAIAQWPDDAPRGSVSTFCVEHGISRKTFYKIRARVKVDGPVAALEPKSRRPARSPNRVREEVKCQAIAVRAALEASGLDHGPISVHDKMAAMGIKDPPSVASLARIFRQAGVARLEPKKKPRAAFRRFVYPQPNSCWQLDAAEYVITRGRKRTIFQLIDDHTRTAIASHVAKSENAHDAIIVVMKGIAEYGVPQRFLSDNHLALNPSRRGFDGELVKYLKSLGVEPITGKPGKPTTQGKNERFHQTLFRYLDKQPLADSTETLQAQVDAFDEIYNNNRPHQGLPGRMTPRQAWAATPVAEPPRPKLIPSIEVPQTGREPSRLTQARPNHPARAKPALQSAKLLQSSIYENGIRTTKVRNDGTIRVRKIEFRIGAKYAGQTAYVKVDKATVEFFDSEGTSIVKYPWPPDGTRYVGTKQLFNTN